MIAPDAQRAVPAHVLRRYSPCVVMSTVAYAAWRTVAGAPSKRRRRHTAPPAGPSLLPPPHLEPHSRVPGDAVLFYVSRGGRGGAGGAGLATLRSQRSPLPRLAPRGARGAAAAAAPHRHGRLRRSKASPRCRAGRVRRLVGEAPRPATLLTAPPRLVCRGVPAAERAACCSQGARSESSQGTSASWRVRPCSDHPFIPPQ